MLVRCLTGLSMSGGSAVRSIGRLCEAILQLVNCSVRQNSLNMPPETFLNLPLSFDCIMIKKRPKRRDIEGQTLQVFVSDEDSGLTASMGIPNLIINVRICWSDLRD